MKKLLSLFLAALLLVAAFPAALAQEEELTLLFTTDIHSNLVPHQALLEGRGERVGGFARLSAAVKAHTVPGSTLLLDSGDFSMGTLYQAYCQSDALELRLMDQIGYDAIALGNHDFELPDGGIREELTRYRESGGSAAILCSNLVAAPGEKAATEANPLADVGVQSYAVVERNGFKIGLFALMGKEAVQYTPADPLAFADPVETARVCVRLLREREGVDLVIALSHSGVTPDQSYTEEIEIAKAVNGIDVILSGHMHQALPLPLEANGTMIACAGTGLAYLGKLTLRRVDGAWVAADHQLIPLTNAWADDPAIVELIAPYTERLETEYMAKYGVSAGLDEVVATTPYDFSDAELFRRCDNHAFGALLADAYLDTLRAEGMNDVWIAGVPTGTVRAGLYRGEMTLMDVYNVLSYGISPLDGSSGAPIITAYLTGSGLYDVCETSISLSGLNG